MQWCKKHSMQSSCECEREKQIKREIIQVSNSIGSLSKCHYIYTIEYYAIINNCVVK